MTSELTPRQEDVVRLIAGGYSVAEAAAAMGVSPATARAHIKFAHLRLDTNSLQGLAAWWWTRHCAELRAAAVVLVATTRQEGGEVLKARMRALAEALR